MKMKTNIKNLIVFLFSIAAMIALPGLASAMSVTINIPEKFSEVKAGEAVYFATEVKWPENDGRKDLRIEYSVRDSSGQEVAYRKVLKAIETQASFMDSIPIYASTKPGLYRIYVTLSDYQDLSQEVTASFRVAKSGGDMQTYLFIIIVMLIVVAISSIVIIIIGILLLIKRKRN